MSGLLPFLLSAGWASTIGILSKGYRRVRRELLRRLGCLSDTTNGLGSQSYFDLISWPLALDSGKAFCVAYIDLDGLKAINNSLGHAVGDAWLRTAADAVRAASGPNVGEWFRRYNAGDELVGIHIGERDAESLGARLLLQLRHRGIRASVGLAVGNAGHDGMARARLLESAESACRAAKHAGGDQALIANVTPMAMEG